MSFIKRHRWDFLCLLLCLLVALGIAAEIVGGAETSTVTLLDFYADWCGPCRQMSPVVETLIGQGYAVQRIDVDRRPDLAAQYSVETIPCFVAVEKGRVVDRAVGLVSRERIVSMCREPVARVVREGGAGLASGTRGGPHPAWRYERPAGCRAAVVRIYALREGGAGLASGTRTIAIGSGTIVRWAGRVCVLTARHVVRGGERFIIEFHTHKAHNARVVSLDTVWDVAVLEVDAVPPGIEPVAIGVGEEARLSAGDRLESCGYGSDAKLAANSGRFVGFRRPGDGSGQGRDDWMVISGPARPGDSGGPVFNSRGHLVGIIWGTNGEEVVCVQPGRIHKALQAAFHQTACDCQGRCPTPPLDAEPPAVAIENLPPVVEETGIEGQAKQPRLAWRREEQAKDQQLQRGLTAVQQEEAAIRQELAGLRQAMQNQPAAKTDPALQGAIEGLDKRLADLETKKAESPVAAPAAPTLHERIHEKAEEVKEKIDGVLESPFAKHLAAILAIVFVVGLGVWIAISQHRKAGTPTLLEKVTSDVATATAGTPIGAATAALAKGVDDVGQRLRDLDAKVDATVEAKFQSLQQQLTQVALATPTAPQAAPAPAAPAAAPQAH